MAKDCVLHWARRHLRWLLCFALLLPVGQLAGAVHAFTHLATTSQQPRDEGDPGHVHCSICAVAAAVGSGGLPSTPVLLHAPSLAVQQLCAPPAVPVHAAPQRRCTNRGPPLFQA